MEPGTQWPSRIVTGLLCTPNGLAENDEYRELSWTAHNAVPGVLVVGGADDLTAGTQRQFAREARVRPRNRPGRDRKPRPSVPG